MLKKLLLIPFLLAAPLYAQITSLTSSHTAASASCLTTNCTNMALPANAATVAVQITGTWEATESFEATLDGSTWNAVYGYPASPGTGIASTTANGVWSFPVSGMIGFRVRRSAHSSGTSVVSLSASPQPTSSGGSVSQSGTWTVQPGNTANTTAWLVTGTGGTFPATQSGTWSFRLLDGSGNAITSTGGAVDMHLKTSALDIVEGSAAGTTPALTGAQAAATEATAVDAGDVIKNRASTVGLQIVNVGSIPQDRWQSNSGGTGVDDTPLISVIAHTDNLFTCITNLQITNKDADTAGEIKIVQGTGTLCATDKVTIWDGWFGFTSGVAYANPEGLFCTTAVSSDVCIEGFASDGALWSASGFKSVLDRVSN